MQCLIPSQNVRIRGLHSLSRIGDDLYVEPTDEYLSFRTVNSAQSAYSSLVFYVSFFTKYKSEFNTEEGGKCKLSMKACLTVFKTPHCMDRNVDSCMIEIDKDCIKLIFHIRFVQGYTKNYFLSVNDNENVQLKYNKEEMCNKMSIPSKTLYGAIKHFRVNDEEITFSATIDKARLKNYFENIEVNSQKLVRTNFSLQPSEFEMYEIKQPGSITFALRELRAVCTFSELSNSSPNITSDYVVSTLPAEMMCTDRPQILCNASDIGFEYYFIIYTLLLPNASKNFSSRINLFPFSLYSSAFTISSGETSLVYLLFSFGNHAYVSQNNRIFFANYVQQNQIQKTGMRNLNNELQLLKILFGLQVDDVFNELFIFSEPPEVEAWKEDFFNYVN
ncbi:hypothetical protein PGB90_009698 [Kerria lacca]